MAEFPALPLWTDAYMADTLDLSLEEHGLYLLMLMLAWRRPDCALPNDMPWLKRSLSACCAGGVHGHTFNARVPKILERFFRLQDDGKWHQKRLDKERLYLRKRSDLGRQNAVKRWSKQSQTELKSFSKGSQTTTQFVQDQLVTTCDPYAPTPTPTPTPISKKEEKKDNICNDFEAFWHFYPKRVGKAIALKSFIVACRSDTSAAIIAGAAAYREWTDRNGTPTQFIAHPSTWLNHGRWSDELMDNTHDTRSDYVSPKARLVSRWLAESSYDNHQNSKRGNGADTRSIIVPIRGSVRAVLGPNDKKDTSHGN